jgi:hypothetical protein
MATLTLRIDKGSPLTNNELDDNFRQLNLTKIEVGGDIGGSTSAPSVISLRGYALSSSAPTTGQALVWSGSAWAASSISTGGGGGGGIVTVLRDISNFFNNQTQSFTLKVDSGSSIATGIHYGDNKDFTVFIGNRSYRPAVAQVSTLGPWIIDFTAEPSYTFKVTGSTITFYRAIEFRQVADIRINTVSASRQQRPRYPFSANSIVLGD